MLGFDPFNEPFSTALVHFHGERDAALECSTRGGPTWARRCTAPRPCTARLTPVQGVIPHPRGQ